MFRNLMSDNWRVINSMAFTWACLRGDNAAGWRCVG